MATCKQCMYMLVESKSCTYVRYAINQCNGRVYRINLSDDTACNLNPCYFVELVALAIFAIFAIHFCKPFD